MIESKVTTRILFAGFIAAFASVTQAEGGSSAFVMTVIEDQAQGDRVVQGDYESAIAGIVARKNSGGFSASNNLCVAYTKTRKLSEAEQACEKALRKSKTASGLRYDLAREKDYAVALSNRGVVRALLGDTEGARQDFERAAKVTDVVTAPAENLALLDARASETVASETVSALK